MYQLKYNIIRRGLILSISSIVIYLLWIYCSYIRDSWYRLPNRASIQMTDQSTKRTDVLLFAYMRGGSTVVGHILGHVSNTFYIYEPLLHESVIGYFLADKVCSIQKDECRYSIEEPSRAIRLLKQNYLCNISGPGLPLMRDKGGPSWQDFAKCTATKASTECEKAIKDNCQKSTFRVSKVLRLSMRMIGQLLEDMDTLKVIFLLRDPRGIMASRQTMGMTFPDSETASESLCKKMYVDCSLANLLEKTYKKRFLKIKYEDIADRPIENAKRMYDFMNYPYTKHDIEMVFSLTQGNATKRAKHWLQEKNTTLIEYVNKYCEQTFEITGYPLRV
ncbi:hypothetical protein ScPMuIL_018863 [Solemya velum]